MCLCVVNIEDHWLPLIHLLNTVQFFYNLNVSFDFAVEIVISEMN